MNKFNTGVQMPVTITTRVDDKLAKLIDEIAEKEGMDRSTILRRFLIKSANKWLIKKSLKDYEEGRITLRQAAKVCNLSLWEIIDEVKEGNIHVPYTLENLQEDLRGLDE